ncbi:MAG: type II secretion system F family protein [Chloroflexi bacterium]|nr:type II secretion system F family protein [Chloroflexota bacterium]
MIYIILVLLLIGGGFILYTLRHSGGPGLMTIQARLGRYGLAGTSAVPAQPAPGAANRQSGLARVVERLVDRGGLTAPIAGRLDRADLRMTPAEFFAIAAVAFLVAALVGLIAKGFLGLFAGGIIGLAAPWFYLGRRIKKRQKAFIEQLADMAQMMGNSMRAGFSIVQSMELVATEGPQPAAYELERAVTEVKLGLPLDTSLDHLLQRQPSEDLELMVVAINVQRQIGGNLSEILAVISQTIRERVRFQRDLKALTAQARYSSYIITALPVCVALIINWMDEPYESFLYTTTLGFMMLGVALCMLGLGFFFLNRIANIEV